MGSSVSGPGSHAEGAPSEVVFLREHDPAWLEIGARIVARLRPLLRRYLTFRDALRGDPGLRHAYAQLKRALAASHPRDRAAYTDGKSGFVLGSTGIG